MLSDANAGFNVGSQNVVGITQRSQNPTADITDSRVDLYERWFVGPSQVSTLYVFENVSAEVCDVCSDTLLAPDTIKSMEQRLRQKKQPSRMVPVLDYA